MDSRLLITNIGYVLSVFFTLGLGAFVLYRNRKEQANIVFFLMSVSIAVFEVSHVIGINISDPALSREVFMWNLTNIFMVIFICHYSLIVAHRVRRQRNSLIFIYVSGLALLAACLFFPYQFLHDSVPKMYLPDYYVPGFLYTVMRSYFIIIACYAVWHLVGAFRATTDPIERNRIKYALAGIVYGSVVGTSANLLIYNIPFDPMWSMFFSLYTIPFAYAIVQYDLMEIHIAAKKALYWAVGITAAGIALSFLNYSDAWLIARFPAFPGWIFPFISSIVVIIIGVSVWKKLKEGEMLKSEFISTVTHKFLPPLERIRENSESLRHLLPPDKQADIEKIQNADARLAELTRLIVGMTESENGGLEYDFEKADLSLLAGEILTNYSEEIGRKHIAVTFRPEPGCFALVDLQKIHFVLQTLLENAISYTPSGRTLFVSVSRKGDNVVFQIKDSGIGITEEESPYVFTKFYRSPEAKAANPEGLGVSLHLSQTIVEKHRGRLWFESEGRGKGALFFFALHAE